MLRAMEDARQFNQWMADTISPFLGDDVLEIGAGIGNLSKLLCPGRRRYVVSDIDTRYLGHLRSQLRSVPNVTTAVCDLRKSRDFEPFLESMDTLICLNVLEHIEDDRSGLRNIHASLRPGGRAIVLVPQSAAAFGTMDEVLGHYRRYSRPELEQKIEAAGFRIERMIEFNRVTYPGWILNGRILRRRTLSRLQLRTFDLLVPLWRRIDRFLPWPPTSLVAVSIKEENAFSHSDHLRSKTCREI
jgi:SAM-dependent methyltransferase